MSKYFPYGFRYCLGQWCAKYARVFGLDLCEVTYEKWEDGEGKVYAPERPELPVWTWNQSELAYQGYAPRATRGPKRDRLRSAHDRLPCRN